LQSPAGKEFSKYLQVAHFANLKNLYQKEQVQPLLSRMSVSLLRYSNLIRLDKVYYEAGINCKKENWLGFAIMLINRYLDIYDVIED
jgi:intraflagellar transport protein 172